MSNTETVKSEEVSVAQRAFSFLLDDYISRNVDPIVGDYLRQMVGKRMTVKAETVKPALPAVASRTMLRIVDPITEATTHVKNCLAMKMPFDRELIARLIGDSQTVDAFIYGFLNEKHGISKGNLPTGSTKRVTKRYMSEEHKAKCRAGQQARWAKIRAEKEAHS